MITGRDAVWRLVFASEAVPEGMRGTIVAHRNIAVARIAGKLYAFGALCPHAAAPLHRHGKLDGCMLTCTHHSWRFDLERGGCEVYGNRGLTMHPVKEDSGNIYVQV